MFETSQEESSPVSAEIIGGVIAVVLVVFAIVYFVYLRHPAATPASQVGTAASAAAGDEKPDPMRDLAILKFNLGRDQTQTMAMWDVQVANRSGKYAYKDIQYATNYYDAQDNLLYRNEATIREQLGPSEQRTISQINDGLYPVGTMRFTMEIKGAQPVQQ